MTFAESARRGATFNARSSVKNPEQFLINMIEGDPTGKPDLLRRRFHEAVSDEDGITVPKDGYLWAIVDYFFTNHYSRLRGKSPTRPRKTASAIEAEKVRVEKLVQLITKKSLLKFVMPSGKMLENSTFGECLHAGGWLS